MDIRPELIKILELIAEKSKNNASTDVNSNTILKDAGLPEEEVRNYLEELKSLKLIAETTRVSGEDIAMLSITQEGLQQLKNQELR